MLDIHRKRGFILVEHQGIHRKNFSGNFVSEMKPCGFGKVKN